jgi:hypothetical protein
MQNADCGIRNLGKIEESFINTSMGWQDFYLNGSLYIKSAGSSGLTIDLTDKRGGCHPVYTPDF